MVLGQGGHHLAILTCFATVVVAGFAGKAVASLFGHSYVEKLPHNSKPDSYTFGSSAA
jgi:hypothetical protein